MKRGHITQQEYIEEAIRQKKTRAAIEDRIFTDMLKIDRPHTTSARVLKKHFSTKCGRVLETWRKGIIVKLPRNGNL